jgi:hypothetical protein
MAGKDSAILVGKKGAIPWVALWPAASLKELAVRARLYFDSFFAASASAVCCASQAR